MSEFAHVHTHTSALCKRPATSDDAPIEMKHLARVNSPLSLGHQSREITPGASWPHSHKGAVTKEASDPQDSGLSKIHLLAPDVIRVA